jgi:hypothetical protein
MIKSPEIKVNPNVKRKKGRVHYLVHTQFTILGSTAC